MRKMFLEAPQLGVAEGSPVAAIEDQDDGSSFGGGRACGGLGVRCEGGIEQIRERDIVALRIRER